MDTHEVIMKKKKKNIQHHKYGKNRIYKSITTRQIKNMTGSKADRSMYNYMNVLYSLDSRVCR